MSDAGHRAAAGGADRFWQRVGRVLGGTALAQAIPILGSLLIARLYAPAEFGLFAAWLGLAYLAAVVVTGRFEAALALEADGEPRRAAARATFVVVGGSALLLLVAALLLWLAGGIAGVPALLLLLFAPTAAALAAAQVWQAWAAGDGRLSALSSMRIAQAVAVTGAQITAGALWPLPLFALRFVASPLSYLFYVAGKQHVDLIWQALLLVLTLATLWLPADLRGALVAYSAGYCAMYGVYLLLSFRYSRGLA